jgi:ABC-type amino acid transport substrate-binding protein
VPRARCAVVAGVVVLALAWLGWRVVWPAVEDQQRFSGMRVLRVGTDPSLQPFTFFSSDGWAGFDADLAGALARELGMEMQPVPVGFDGRYDALDRNLVDIVISAVSVDPAQTERAAYSRAYVDVGPRLLLPADSPADGVPAVLARKRVAVALGGASDRAARFHERRSVAMTRVPATDDAAALAELQTGAVDAAVVDGLFALKRGCPLVGDGVGAFRCIALAPNGYVAVVRKSDARLLHAIDAALAQLRASGAIERFATQWLRM